MPSINREGIRNRNISELGIVEEGESAELFLRGRSMKTENIYRFRDTLPGAKGIS